MPESGPPPNKILLLVEGETDRVLLVHLLEATLFPPMVIEVRAAAGFRQLATEAEAADHQGLRVAILADAGEAHLPDAERLVRERLGNPSCTVFVAIPAVEAWLFADTEVAARNASPEPEIQAMIRRLPLPEEIPEPKRLAREAFGPPRTWGFLREIDVGRACARSASLSAFLRGLSELSGVPIGGLERAVSRSLSRDLLANLLQEVAPSDTVIWRTTDGHAYTAMELERHIREGDELGLQYASDLLRIARDFLGRSARRGKAA